MKEQNNNTQVAKYMESQVSKLRDKWDECAGAICWSKQDLEEVVDVCKLGKSKTYLGTALRLQNEIEAEVVALSGMPLTEDAQQGLRVLKQELEDWQPEHEKLLQLHKCLERVIAQVQAE